MLRSTQTVQPPPQINRVGMDSYWSSMVLKSTKGVDTLCALLTMLQKLQLRSADLSTLRTTQGLFILVSDSQLVLRYASGEYQCRKPHLVPLYCKLRQLHNKLNIKTRWVKGHSGDLHNERCDILAKTARGDPNVADGTVNTVVATLDVATS